MQMFTAPINNNLNESDLHTFYEIIFPLQKCHLMILHSLTLYPF